MIARLRRVTSTKNYIPELDGLRFIAIAGVILKHGYELFLRNGPLQFTDAPTGYIDYVFGSAGRGVELFFVISGFILGIPFVRHYLAGAKRVELKKYFVRRLTRLEPPYVIIMVGLFLVFVFPPIARLVGAGDPAVLAKSLLASLFYSHWFIFQEPPALNVVAWSLEIEVQFYILAPLLAFLVLRYRNAKFAIVACVAIIASAPFIQAYLGVSRYTILGEYHFFVAGILLAILYSEGRRIRLNRWVDFFGGLVLLLAIFSIPIRDAEPINHLVFIGLILVFYLVTLSGGTWSRILSVPWIAVTGGMCYTIYLLHWHLIGAYMTLGGPLIQATKVSGGFWPNFLIHLAGSSALVMAVSVAFFVLVERPCMDPAWPSKLAERVRGRKKQEEAAGG